MSNSANTHRTRSPPPLLTPGALCPLRAQEDSVARIVGSAADGCEGAVVAVELKSGGEPLPADIVVVGVGARPVLFPFEAALERAPAPAGGFAVDSLLRASGPGVPPGSVFAIGDVAAFPQLISGCGFAQ
jgi:NADPH-dependent 2,4-dienoyl-CoA reductase/sulfur reductase-like enzyme